MATSTPDNEQQTQVATESAPANPEAQNQESVSPDDLQVIIEQIKTNLQSSLEDSKMDAFIRAQVKKVKDWDTWTQQAKLAYANILTTEILYTHSDVMAASKELSVDVGDHRQNFLNFIESLKDRVAKRKAKLELIAARKAP